MPTFTELTQRLQDARFRRAILLHLTEHIDETFRPHAGEKPEKMLLTDEKTPVPVSMFDSVVEDTLLAEVKQLDQVIAEITGMSLVPAPPPPPPQPEQPAASPATPPPADRTTRRRRAERA